MRLYKVKEAVNSFVKAAALRVTIFLDIVKATKGRSIGVGRDQ
jgi:hypothetical protein